MLSATQSPADADALYELGRGRRASRDDAGAEENYRQALLVRPAFPEAWISLGILLKQKGQLAEAEAAQRNALQYDPDNFVALLNLGNVLRAQRRSDAAEAAFRASLAANPQCAEAHNNLGRLLLDQDRRVDAAPHFLEALNLNPNYFEAASGISEALLQADQFAAALKPLQQAHALRPNDLKVMRDLGRAYTGVCDYPRAAALFEQLLAKNPDNPLARLDLALVQFYSGQYTRPRTTFEALLADGPDGHIGMAYSSLLLRAGEFREGWKHYESRWQMGKEPGLRNFPEPRWQGESLLGKTLLLTAEQGLGDEIMFASIFPEILRLADHCIIECDERLVPLYRRSFPGATVFGVNNADVDWHTRLDAARASLPRFDYWAPVGDLGPRRRNEAADFPRHPGYLQADAARVREFRERLQTRGGNGLKVGIGWKGGTRASRSVLRSMELKDLQPLFTLPGTHFVSLQYGKCQGELDAFARESGVAIDHWQADIDDIDAYAALISSLDVVLSVCSAVIHLGGALGRPSWVMAPLVPEWRYGREAESMIWYPSVRMFRQEKSSEWGKVIANVRRALQKQIREASTRGTAA
jgi:tetratricopeptide (TPR) repeat protein